MNLRRIVFIFVPVLLILVVVIVILFLGRNEQPQETNPPITTKEITGSQLAQHNSQADCWTIITASVYNLTPFFDKNPNPELASKICGGTGTEALKPLASAESKTLSEKFDIYRIGIIVP